MANSKSNIYPIQLQNAELNLNKYDAEIKQYSGFNKNNSPFVGDCLSNVFTKEEQIEGGNADNVYIDTNGDVYRVDTEGFYKNDEKLITYDENVRFYRKRKIATPPNLVKIINDKVYISKEKREITETSWEGGSRTYTDYAFVAHWGDGFSRVLCCSQLSTSVSEVFADISYKEGCIVFTVKRYKTISGSGVNALSYVIIVPDENQETYFEYKPGTNSTFYVGDIAYADTVTQTVFIDNDYIYYAENVHKTGALGSKVYVFEKQENTINYIGSFREFTYSPPNELYIVPSYAFGNWFMDGEGKFYYMGGDNIVFGASTGNRNRFIYYKFGIRYSNNALAVYQNSAETLGVTSAAGKTVGVACKREYVTQYCVFYTLVFTDTSDNTKGFIFSYSNDFQNLAFSMPNCEWVTGATAFRKGFKILYNNGVISNISIAKYRYVYSLDFYPAPYNDQSEHGAIIEDWNIIKDFSIYDNKCVYVTYDGRCFIIEETTEPKLSLSNNQLVINCNDENNCFSLELQEVLHFASDWNCSYLASYGTTFNAYNYYGTKPAENSYFIASAINEHNRKLNPSLILNMQAVAYPLSGSTYKAPEIMTKYNLVNFNKSSFIDNYKFTVNFYTGTLEQNTATYLVSSDSQYNKDLGGLIFPNNTDGNIPYNPSLFSEFIQNFGIDIFVKNDNNVYQLMKEGQENIMSFFLGTLVEGLDLVFVLQGQYYGIINNKLFGLQFNNGVIADTFFIVNVQGLQFVGNTPYEALFYSKTNRCLYSFTGANVLNQRQLIDKINEVRNYLYNPATQTVFLITDIGVLFYGLFGMFLLEYTDITNIFLLDNGIVMSNNEGNYRYIRYYLDEGDEDYIKQNIKLETCFYGMNNQTITINDCLYMRLFSEEHEEGAIEVSATTLSLQGRVTEKTTFNIHASDWDKETHTIYLRYQPKEQRGLGISFNIESPFKIASMSVGSQADAILVDKISKGAINAPFNNQSSTIDW